MKNILILGAGASRPFYQPELTTKHLTNVISNNGKWRDIVRKYTKKMGVNHSMVNTKVVLQVLQKIKHQNYNFEQIIEICDKISSFNINNPPKSKILHDILLYYGAKAPNSSNHVWDWVPFLFRQIIAEEIADLHQNHKVEAYCSLTNLQTQFISSISEGKSINIYTLNYDEIILDAIQNLGFTTGFENQGRFCVNTFLSADRTISFLHGHSRFSFDDDDIMYHATSQEANKHRLDKLPAGNNIKAHDQTRTKHFIDSSYSYAFNTFISTGQQKESTFDINPYSVYYQKFACDCLKANKIYVIGYSFSDLHINRIISNFLKISPCKKIVIVDFLSNPVHIVHDFKRPGSFIQKTFNIFGINGVATCNNGQDYFYRKKEQDLNNIGFAEIYPRIFLHKNGYETFLNKYSLAELFKLIEKP